jgi:hypothetical protein
MSSRRFRPVGSALVLAVLLALAAPPAQASGGSTLLDNLGAKVQIWLAGWLPGGRIEAIGAINPSRGAAFGGRVRQQGIEGRGSHQSRSIRPVIRPECNSVSDPNGCPPG